MTHELEVVLCVTVDAGERIRHEIGALGGDVRATAERLDVADRRVDRLLDQVDLPGRPIVPVANRPSRRPDEWPSQTWEELVRRAEAELRERGIDLDAVSVDDLLSADAAQTIEWLHGNVELRVRLDGYDVVAAVVAAAIGTLIDFTVVRIPSGVRWKGVWQPASPLTFFFRRRAVRSDNWLAKFAPVPFDKTAVPVTGLGPRSHRVQTFGHDPLLGLVLGTTDILRGTLTGIGATGEVVVLDSAPPTPGLIAALGTEILHLVSDVGTRMGLPLPGWTALVAAPVGKFGPDGNTVGAIARWMYLRGYGSWHFLTMATVPAAVEAVLRSYIGMRQMVDDEYRKRWEAEGVDSDGVGSHPRYRVLSLVAHGITALGNAGRLVFSGLNPLTVNYAEWVVLVKRLVAALQSPPAARLLRARMRLNRLTLDTGWVRLGIDPEMF